VHLKIANIAINFITVTDQVLFASRCSTHSPLCINLTREYPIAHHTLQHPTPPGCRNFSPEEHLSATVKHRSRQDEVIPPSLLDTPRLPLIWRTCTYFLFPLSCSIRQRQKHAGPRNDSSRHTVSPEEAIDVAAHAFELSKLFCTLSTSPSSLRGSGTSPALTSEPQPHRRSSPEP
jgi:hypothetical protein